MPKDIYPLNIPESRRDASQRGSNIEPVVRDAVLGEVGSFLSGAYALVLSSWLTAVQYDPFLREMKTWFKGGYACRLLDVTEEIAESFYYAGSKGTWWHETVLGPRYKRGRRETARMRWIDYV